MSDIEMMPLRSSHVVAAGFDADTGTLVVGFKGGKRYVWQGVSQADYDGLVQAESPGQHLRYVIEERFGKGLPAS